MASTLEAPELTHRFLPTGYAENEHERHLSAYTTYITRVFQTRSLPSSPAAS